ncbi:MAG: serine/threonine-protein kinase, partial [Acidobacteriota bacterium]
MPYGPYQVIKDLAAGGMGRVALAVHEDTGRRVALKTVRVKEAWLLAGIRREIHALSRIRHPGVVAVLDHGVLDGVPWYAMELVAGQSLGELAWIARAGRDGRATGSTAAAGPPRTEAATQRAEPGAGDAGEPAPAERGARDLGDLLTLARRVCAPLAYIHGEGLVHRDLKPDNVLVRPDGSPVLVDFGLAATHDPELWRESIATDDDASGTLAYMSP